MDGGREVLGADSALQMIEASLTQWYQKVVLSFVWYWLVQLGISLGVDLWVVNGAVNITEIIGMDTDTK